MLGIVSFHTRFPYSLYDIDLLLFICLGIVRSKACINTKLFGLVSKKGHRAFLLLIEALFQNQLDSIADKLLTYVAAQSSEQSFIALPSSPLAGKNDFIECNMRVEGRKAR